MKFSQIYIYYLSVILVNHIYNLHPGMIQALTDFSLNMPSIRGKITAHSLEWH